MFKKFFDTVALNATLKKQKEAIKTVKADVELSLELMEHPVKAQKQIKTTLNNLKDICEKAI